MDRTEKNFMDEWIKKATDYLEFCLKASCGHCVPCRLGLPKIRNLLKDLTGGQKEGAEWNQLESLIRTVSSSSLCPVGQISPLPIKDLLACLKSNKREFGHMEKLLEVVRCSLCHRPFAFKGFLVYLQSKVDPRLGVQVERQFCPECARKAYAINMMDL